MLVDIDLREYLSVEPLAINVFSITLVPYYLVVINAMWIFFFVLIA